MGFDAVAIRSEIVFRCDAVEAGEQQKELVGFAWDEQRRGNGFVEGDGDASTGLQQSKVFIELNDAESRGGDLGRVALLVYVVARDEDGSVETGDEETRRDAEFGGLDGDARGACVDVEVDELLLLPHEEERFRFLARDEEVAHVAGRRVFVQQHRRVEVDQHGDQAERIVPIDHIVRIACGHHQRGNAA